MSRTARVIAASNRAAAGVYEDRTGPVIVAWLRERGYDVPEPIVVPDGDPVATALADAVAARVDVVVTTGGTGHQPHRPDAGGDQARSWTTRCPASPTRSGPPACLRCPRPCCPGAWPGWRAGRSW